MFAVVTPLYIIYLCIRFRVLYIKKTKYLKNKEYSLGTKILFVLIYKFSLIKIFFPK